MHNTPENAAAAAVGQEERASSAFVRHFTQRCIYMVSDELSKQETHELLRTKVISPIINMLYVALYPYIVCCVVIVSLILVASILTLAFFLLDHFKKR